MALHNIIPASPTPMPAPSEIVDLVDRFDRNAEAYRSPAYNETQVRREFIDPFFKCLGWDIDNTQGFAEAYKDVIHEDAIKIGGAMKAPDYCFQAGAQAPSCRHMKGLPFHWEVRFDKRPNHFRCLAVALLLLSGCAGSGDQRAEVSGTIRLDGQLVEEGSIQFIPVDGTKGASAGGIIEKGKYHIAREKGATVGKNRVELRTFRKTGKMVQDPTGPPGTKTEERVQAFPPEYNDKSALFREVEASGNQFDFDVRTKGKGK